MRCPKCWAKHYVKNWMNNWKQRYLCKECWTNFTKSYRWRVHPNKKKMALKLYLEWMWFRQIWRVLWVSNVSVLKWIRQFWYMALIVYELFIKAGVKKIKEMEVDEMWHYIKKKHKSYGYGSVLSDQMQEYLLGIVEIVEKNDEKVLWRLLKVVK